MDEIPDYNYNSGKIVGALCEVIKNEVFIINFLQSISSVLLEKCGRIRLKVVEKTGKLVTKQNYRSFLREGGSNRI